MSRSITKLVVTIIGGVIIFVGVLLLVLPGPGILLILAGITLLGREYHWARRLVEPVRRRLERLRARAKQKR